MSKEKIKTLKCIECKEEFYSNYDKSEVCPTCYYKNKKKEKDQRIAELEEQLKNAIVLKYKIGQEIWETKPFRSWKVKEIELKEIDRNLWEVYRLTHDNTDDYNCCIVPIENDRFFATKEEALAKLEELKGENK